MIRFDNRQPRNMYGWVRVTKGDPDDIGKTTWFHYNDGQFVQSLCDGGGEFEWAGPESFDDWWSPLGSRLELPKRGDIIAFEWGENAKGPKALPWTHQRHLYNVAMTYGDELRIVCANGSIAWHGWYHADMRFIVTISGKVPREFDGMTIEINMPDDVFDGPCDSYLIPGRWESTAFPLETWGQLLQVDDLARS